MGLGDRDYMRRQGRRDRYHDRLDTPPRIQGRAGRRASHNLIWALLVSLALALGAHQLHAVTVGGHHFSVWPHFQRR